MLVTACQPAAPEAPAVEEPAGEEQAAEEAAVEEVAEEAAPEEVVTLNWWTVNSEEYTEEAQRAMAAEFEKTHPNIKINVTVLPESGFTDKMTTTLGAGEGAPDVAFFWDVNWFPMALDLRPYIEKTGFDTSMYFPEFFKTRAFWGEKVIGLPLGVGASFVMYNKDILDEAGIAYPDMDWTTEDYIEIVSQLSNPDIKRFGGDRPRYPYRAIWFNYGAKPYSDDSTTVDGYLNGPESVAAYTWLWDLVNSGGTPTPADLEVFGTEGTGPIDLFIAGRLAMATLNQGHMLNALDAGVNFGIVPEPTVSGNERYVNAWSLTSSIWSGTEHPDEAFEFLSWWCGPEGQKFLMENGNLFPSIPAVLEEYEDYDTEYAQAFFEVLTYRQVSEWRGEHRCESAVRRAAGDIWDLINLNDVSRDEIQTLLDEVVPAAQQALDDCVATLGS
jgi:multiple sugar transport system substrate-binding protein